MLIQALNLSVAMLVSIGNLIRRAKRDPKAQMLSLQSFLREGRVVGPSWEKLKPKGPKGRVQGLIDIKDTHRPTTLR
jgi:hypothetical protein